MRPHDARWVVWCMEIGWRARARRHARLCVKESPLRPYSWRLLLSSHLGPLERLLDPQPAKRQEAKPRGRDEGVGCSPPVTRGARTGA